MEEPGPRELRDRMTLYLPVAMRRAIRNDFNMIFYASQVRIVTPSTTEIVRDISGMRTELYPVGITMIDC